MGLPKFLKRQAGFTLVELLIVIAVICVLISIGLASYSRAQRSARDSQRKADLRNVAGALEQFYADFNRYPKGGTFNYPGINDSSCNPNRPRWGQNPLTCGGKTYLAQLPQDPLGTSYSSYLYITCGSTQLYVLYARLEKAETIVGPPSSCPRPSGVPNAGASGSSNWYYVMPQ